MGGFLYICAVIVIYLNLEMHKLLFLFSTLLLSVFNQTKKKKEIFCAPVLLCKL